MEGKLRGGEEKEEGGGKGRGVPDLKVEKVATLFDSLVYIVACSQEKITTITRELADRK